MEIYKGYIIEYRKPGGVTLVYKDGDLQITYLKNSETQGLELAKEYIDNMERYGDK